MHENGITLHEHETIFETTGNGQVIIDDDMTITKANHSFELLSGYTKSEIEGKLKWTEFACADDIGKMVIYHKNRRIDPKLAPRAYEWKFRHRTGWIKHVFMSIDMISGTKFSIASIMDITELKYAEEKIKSSEAWYKTLLEESPVSIIGFDENGIISFINNYHLEHFAGGAVGKEFYLGKHVTELPGAAKAGISGKFADILDGKTVDFKEIYFPEFTSGKSGYTNTRGVPIVKDGKIIGGILIREDVTELKKVQQDLLAAVEQNRSIINNAEELIVYVDKDFQVQSWNRSIAERSGIPTKEIIGCRIDIAGKGIQPLADLMKTSITRKKGDLAEHLIADKNDNKRTILSNVSLIRSDDGVIQGAILIGRDITKHRALHGKICGGHAYLYTHGTFEDMIAAVGGMDGYSHLCIMRKDNQAVKSTLSSCRFLRISDDLDLLTEEVMSHIKNNPKTAITLQGAEYIYMMHGFNRLMKLIYMLSDAVESTKSLICIYLVKGILNENEFILAASELEPFPNVPREEMVLDDKKKEILKFISNKNLVNSSVSFGLVSLEFGLSRMTTKKWLFELQQKNLLTIKKSGKLKNIFISEKGSRLMQGY